MPEQQPEEAPTSGYALATETFYYFHLSWRAWPEFGWKAGTALVVFDRSTNAWSRFSIPEGINTVAEPSWTGKEVLHWGAGGRKVVGNNPVVYPDTPMVQYYDGALFNPQTGEWRAIPPAREDAEYLWGEGGPALASVYTSAGLFVWGTNPERTERWGALFDVETMTWEILDIDDDAPPLLRGLRLLSLGDEVFLFGGVGPGKSAPWRRLWRYSLTSRTWTEVDVPTWADPYVGTVVRDRLAFMGRCVGGDLYDPATDTWKPLADEGAPPSEGSARGAGSFLTVTDTYYGEAETNEVWLLDLRGELGD